MKLYAKKVSLKDIKTDVLVVPLFKDMKKQSKLYKELNGLVGLPALDLEKFGEDGSFMSSFAGKRLLLFLGLGEKSKLTLEKLRKLGGKLAKYLQSKQLKSSALLSFGFGLGKLPLNESSRAFADGMFLGAYGFYKFKTDDAAKKKKELSSLTFIIEEKKNERVVQRAFDFSSIVSANTNMVRDLVNTPANVATPKYCSSFASKVAKKVGLKCTILGKSELKKEKMGCFLSVAQGSAQEPQMVILEHKAKKKNAPTYVFVGKGVTFDTGGYNMKGTGYMETMKTDKAGAMCVLGTMKAVAELKLNVNVIGILGLAENMVSDRASRPSDVVTASNGKTVEIMNTDAEGRLVLSDCLVYASRYKPTATFDVATLTGAVGVALGNHYTGMMGNDSRLFSQFTSAGEDVHERVWQLPLGDDYDDAIKGEVADIKNIGYPKGKGGTITAAAFLKQFVTGRWVHFDIASTGRSDGAGDYIPQGATGVGVRLFVEFLRKR
jgi:leucyl aminopeptidase